LHLTLSVEDQDAAEIVDAVALAFEYFTRRAGSIPIPESFPTWDNLQFASAVTRLDRVSP